MIGIKTKIEHELVSQDEKREVPENEDSENSIDNTKVRELNLNLQDDEELRRKIEPLLVYKDEYVLHECISLSYVELFKCTFGFPPHNSYPTCLSRLN